MSFGHDSFEAFFKRLSQLFISFLCFSASTIANEYSVKCFGLVKTTLVTVIMTF